MWPTSAAALARAPSPCRRPNPLRPSAPQKRPSRRSSLPSGRRATPSPRRASKRRTSANVRVPRRARLAERTQRRIRAPARRLRAPDRRRGGRTAVASRRVGPAARAGLSTRPPSSTRPWPGWRRTHRGRHRDRRRQPGVRACAHLGPSRPAARRGVVASHRNHTRVGRPARAGAWQCRSPAGWKASGPAADVHAIEAARAPPLARAGGRGRDLDAAGLEPGHRLVRRAGRPAGAAAPGARWRGAAVDGRGSPAARPASMAACPAQGPAGVALLEAARADPQRVLSLWRDAWQRCLPRTGERHAVEARLAPLLTSHAAAFRLAAGSGRLGAATPAAGAPDPASSPHAGRAGHGFHLPGAVGAGVRTRAR